MTNDPQIRVNMARSFLRELKQLKKKYRHVRDDVEELVEQLQRGEKPGDLLQDVQEGVYKVRLANRDAQRGTRSGYRVIYYVQLEESILLVFIYSKSDIADVSPNEIKRLIDEAEQSLDDDNLKP